MENVRWWGRRMLDGHAGSAIKVLVAIHYSVLDVRNGYIRNVVVACWKSFICRGCLNPVTSAVRTSVDIGASAKLELVDKFCYLGTWRCWCSCGELVGISSGSWLTNKDVSLIMRERLCSSCVRDSMLHGRKGKCDGEQRWEWSGVKLKDRLPSKELRERLGVDDIALILQQNRLRWYGHVLRKDDVKLRVQDQGKTWKEDCQARKLNKEDAVDHCKWRKEVRWPGWVNVSSATRVARTNSRWIVVVTYSTSCF